MPKHFRTRAKLSYCKDSIGVLSGTYAILFGVYFTFLEAKKVEEPRPSEWSSWSRCSTSCGEGSMKTRSKYCDENSTSDAIVKCPGWNHQSIPCNVSHHCPGNETTTFGNKLALRGVYKSNLLIVQFS